MSPRRRKTPERARPPVSVLLTGASGFIGRHAVREFASAGWRIRVLVRPASDIETLRDLSPEVYVGDVATGEGLAAAVRGVDAVVHLAGRLTAPDQEAHRRLHVDGTLNLLDAIEKNDSPLRRFVHVSSLAALGPARDGSLPDESAPARPIGPYGRTKLESEAAVLERASRFPVTVIRPPVVYGPGDRSLLPLFQAIRAGAMFLPDRGEVGVSTVHAADLAAALRLAVEVPHDSGSLFFVADGPPRRFRDLAEAIRLAQETPAIPISLPPAALSWVSAVGRFLLARSIDLPNWIHPDTLVFLQTGPWVCSADRIRDRLGWLPRVPLAGGLEATVAWYRRNGWLLRAWGDVAERFSRPPPPADESPPR